MVCRSLVEMIFALTSVPVVFAELVEIKVMNMVWKTLLPGVLVAFVILLGACKDLHQSVDLDRHKYSNLRTSMNKSDVMVFEAKATLEAPVEGEPGEAVRMQWLEGWLAQRGQCGNGYEVLERRPYQRNDANPYGFDLRYEVRCKALPADPSE